MYYANGSVCIQIDVKIGTKKNKQLIKSKMNEGNVNGEKNALLLYILNIERALSTLE